MVVSAFLPAAFLANGLPLAGGVPFFLTGGFEAALPAAFFGGKAMDSLS